MKYPIVNVTGETPGNNRKRLSYHRRSVIWIGLMIIIFLLSFFLPDSIFDQFYYRHIFGWIRITYDTFFGWSPIPMVYIVSGLIIFRIIRWAGQWSKGSTYQVSRAIGGIAMIISLFYILWGFNYNQIPLQERLGLNLEKVNQEDIALEFARATEVLKIEAMNLPHALKADSSILHLKVTDHDLRADVRRALAELKVPNRGRVRVRQLWPNGILLRWSTAGIYIPHAVEGHIDNGLLSIQKPFTIAHEMAHGYGIADEGASNFIAWLACSQSADPWIRFGGAFMYWRYVAAEMPDEMVIEVIESLDPVVLRSLILVRENDNRYPDLLPQIRDSIYSSYLKQHGVKGGLRSYNYVVLMVSEYLGNKYNPDGNE